MKHLPPLIRCFHTTDCGNLIEGRPVLATLSSHQSEGDALSYQYAKTNYDQIGKWLRLCS